MFMTFHQEITDCLENMGCTDVEVMEDSSPEDESQGGNYIIQVFFAHPNFPNGLVMLVYAEARGDYRSDELHTFYNCFYVQVDDDSGIQFIRESNCIASWEELKDCLNSGILKDSEN